MVQLKNFLTPPPCSALVHAIFVCATYLPIRQSKDNHSVPIDRSNDQRCRLLMYRKMENLKKFLFKLFSEYSHFLGLFFCGMYLLGVTPSFKCYQGFWCFIVFWCKEKLHLLVFEKTKRV